MTDTTPIEPTAAEDAAPAGSDAALLEAVRHGDLSAYGPLYDRHHDAALALARRLTRSRAEAEDVAADAFDRVMRAIGNGAGPTEAFRAYLLTAVRRTAWRRSEQNNRERGVEDEATLDLLLPPVGDSDSDDADHAMAVEAFTQLPERWQLVLWHTLVEDKKPAEVAPLLGLSPNATAALAVRAREGLREAYLQTHLNASVPTGCQFTVDRLGASVRDNLGKRDRAKVDEHLASCERCSTLEQELGSVNGLMRSVIGPAVLGIGVGEYRSGFGGGPEATGLRRISFNRAAAVSAAAAVALVALGLSSDFADPPTRTAATQRALDPSSGADDGDLGVLVASQTPLTPVTAEPCRGPELPVDLAPGAVIAEARAVRSAGTVSTPGATTSIPSRPVTQSTAATLAAADDGPIVTASGVCASSLVGLGDDIGLLLRTRNPDGSIVLRVVDHLVSDAVTVLRTAVQASEDAVTDTEAQELPAAPTPPSGPLPDGAAPSLPVDPGGTPQPTLPRIDPEELPAIRELVDDLTTDGLL